MASTHTCDLLIVGAGPVGLYAAYYAGFRGWSTVIMDTLPEAGGQITDFDNTAQHDRISVSASSFGGGLTAWLYREVVDRSIESHARIISHVESFRANPNARRNAPLIPELVEALRRSNRDRERDGNRDGEDISEQHLVSRDPAVPQQFRKLVDERPGNLGR